MPVVPFSQRPAEPAIPDWAMPSETHLAMAAAEMVQLATLEGKDFQGPPIDPKSGMPTDPMHYDVLEHKVGKESADVIQDYDLLITQHGSPQQKRGWEIHRQSVIDGMERQREITKRGQRNLPSEQIKKRQRKYQLAEDEET